MLKITGINNINNNLFKKISEKSSDTINSDATIPENLKRVNSTNLKAYHPSFTSKQQKNEKVNTKQIPSTKQQIIVVSSKLDKETKAALNRLNEKGILTDNSSNDGSTVIENLYKIATEQRIPGLDENQIISEVVKALDNPYSITQKFGDIPQNVANEISKETGNEFPQNAYNVVSSSCVVASMEFNLASLKPAEFARFAEGLSSSDYSVDKKIKMSDIAEGTAEGIWKLREFNTTNKIDKNWEDVTINIHPDRNAIVRARVQTSYKDPNERSCVDVLIQSALLNLGSQNSYDSIIDERNGKFNPDKSGLTDFEKNFVEQIVFEAPKISVVYQDIDENGYLIGYNCEASETKQHILKSLKLGQNVIIGYTHLDENNKVDGGHEITIIGYKEDKDGKGYFICNDTDDEINEPVIYSEEKLLPLIHHAGISKEALNKDDFIVEPWREILEDYKQSLAV